MTTWTKRIGIVVTTVALLAGQAAMALARAGGGKGGSLGGSAGRSFGGGSFSGGGLSGGGYSGGFGGFHGFFPFPFFFFGGSGGGSSFGGLFSFLFLVLILYLIFKALRSSRRWRQGRSGGGFGRPPYNSGPYTGRREDIEDLPGTVPVDLNGRPITNSNNLQRFAKAISFTRDNMGYFAETFNRWDRDYLVGRVRQIFFWFQDAWSRQDLSQAGEYLSPSLIEKYQAELAGMKTRGERNMIKDPMLNPGDLEFIHSHLGEGDEHLIVMIYASLVDYTVDSSGRLIAGEDDNRLYFTEFWEFVWQGDKWVLDKIYQEDALEIAKIARGEEQS